MRFKFTEYKAILLSISISVAAFLLFLALFSGYRYLGELKQAKQEHQVIQAVYKNENILLYTQSISVPELPQINGIGLAEAFQDTFATEVCLYQANQESLTIESELLPVGNITVFDDIWYQQVSAVPNFQQTLFAEGYFGLISISRPCYNATVDRAIIYLEQDCGPDCGVGEVIYLIFDSGEWERTAQRTIWVG